MFSYVVSGLTVTSELVLPGLIAAPRSHDTPDVTIRQGSVADDPAGGDTNWWMHDDGVVLEVPRIVRMDMRGGREIVVAPIGATTLAEVAVFVTGSGFGILLHQRERIVLHASAVRVGDGAVLLCGVSGAGKSTLAAALVEAGHDLVSDDFCAIAMDAAGRPVVQPDGRQLKLWENAIQRLDLGTRQADRVRPQIRKYHVEPHTAFSGPLPIVALYMLREARPPSVAGIARPNLVDGALMVRANAYRPALVRRMGQGDIYFRAAAALAARAGVFTLTRDLDFAAFPTVLGWLRAHWADIGLLEAAA